MKVRKYDLEARTHKFAKDVRIFLRSIPKTISNQEDGKQLIRSSGSVAANYMEASEAVSRKGFANQLKICKRESKESWHWLDCLDVGQSRNAEIIRSKLMQEATELVRIFAAALKTLDH